MGAPLTSPPSFPISPGRAAPPGFPPSPIILDRVMRAAAIAVIRSRPAHPIRISSCPPSLVIAPALAGDASFANLARAPPL